MAILRESPWYQEILEEGREQGRRVNVLHFLEYRFVKVPAEIEDALGELDMEALDRLLDAALKAVTLDEFRSHLPPASAGADGAISSPSSGA